MDFSNIYSEMNSMVPETTDEIIDPSLMPPSYEPKYSMFDYNDPSLYASWDDYALGIRGVPVLYNAEAYSSPFVQNWINPTGIMGELASEMQLNASNPKLDPNKIFSPDITAMKALAADQQKIVKLFERKLIESLSEKGKIGLTEEDVEAMQALTAARSAITAMNKSQVDIKKNIADIRLKQQQNATRAEVGTGTQSGVQGRGTSSMDIGRSILDGIFTNMPSPPPQQQTQQMSDAYRATSLDEAANVLDNILPTDIDPHTRYESQKPQTVVLIGETDDDIEFATFAADGTLIPDYPNPTSTIEKIDRDAGVAVDDMLQPYPLRSK